MQITSGIRSVLSNPLVYLLAQKLIGSEKSRKQIYSEIVSAQSGNNVLDIGCGPARSLGYLGDVNYWGYDISPEYIADANNTYGEKGQFFCKYFEESDLDSIPSMDICLMSGVLHHMSDDEASRVLKLAAKALGDGGRLITIDPVFTEKQNPIAKFLISKDRGQNVRNEPGYTDLLKAHFKDVKPIIRHKHFIPYTSCICTAGSPIK